VFIYIVNMYILGSSYWDKQT